MPGGDHSSRSRIASGLKQPTRGSQHPTPSSEAHTGWASPPLLFGLAPRGVFRAPDVAIRAVGSYPTFSPLPNAPDRNRQVRGITENLPPRCKLTGGLIFCGTFRSRAAVANLRPPRCATPWRYQARCPAVALSCELATAGVRTFLPPILRPPCDGLKTSRRSPGSPASTSIRHTPSHSAPPFVQMRRGRHSRGEDEGDRREA
jgi:hypothetical protein